MKISLKNVAIVEKAKIEIDGITVVAGLNGSGKTTVAKAIYASVNAYKDLSRRISNSRKGSIFAAVFGVLNQNVKLRHGMDSYNMANSFVDSLSLCDFIGKDKSECDEILKLFINDWMKEKTEINNDAKDKIYQNVLDVITRSEEAYTKYLAESMFLSVFSKQINCLQNDTLADIKMDIDDMQLHSAFLNNELVINERNIEYSKKAIYIESFNVLDMIKNNNPYSRSQRNATVASKELFKNLYADADALDRSFEEYENNKELTSIIDIIISRVTHGKLKVDTYGNVDFHDNTTNKPINIENLSAGIKVFVILQSLLENGQLKKEDILLIDEPEVNLHPEWQVVFAEILVLLQKEIGLNIYVNTHSPYFARAIEVKLAENGIADKGRFYLFREQENNLCISEDVTNCTERIYSMLYKPLESL